MKLFVSALLVSLVCIQANAFLGVKNPLKAFGKCISDSECKSNEFCDHTGINPIGDCKIGYPDNSKCTFDRHCKSKVCHLFKCVGKKPVKDGPCTKDYHNECLPEQYCSKSKDYHCKDRKCKGFCLKDYHCISGSCRKSFFSRCEKPPKDSVLATNLC